jgi:TIR domain
MADNDKKYGVFISYSHEDTMLIAPVVSLIRVMRKDLVFQDYADIHPGKRWEPQLNRALEDAELIIVFWCGHSAKSGYVKKEFEYAIKSDKDVLPVLLDDCKLDNDLADYQWIDFKNIITHRADEPKITERTEDIKITERNKEPYYRDEGSSPNPDYAEQKMGRPPMQSPLSSRGVKTTLVRILYIIAPIGIISYLLFHRNMPNSFDYPKMNHPNGTSTGPSSIPNAYLTNFSVTLAVLCFVALFFIVLLISALIKNSRQKQLNKSTDAVSMKPPGKVSVAPKESSKQQNESIVIAEEIRKQLDKKLPPR